MNVTVFAVDGVFDSGLSIVLDVLATATELARTLPNAATFTITPVGLGAEVRTTHGMRLATTPLAALTERPELVVIPALGEKDPAGLVDVVRRHPALAWLTDLHGQRVPLAAACTATFLLGEAGLLDGGPATTSWWLGSAFRKRYPAVELDETRILARAGTLTTAGAAFAHIDLALSVVAGSSPALAELVARYLVATPRSLQSAFVVPAVLTRPDPVLTAYETWVREHLDEPIQISRAARAVGVSERSLQRATAAELGMSPIQLVHHIRADQALHLLRTTDRSLHSITTAVGYRNVGTLRSLLRRHHGTTPAEVRRALRPHATV
ncbi:MAG TPA: helix-turn-helix domain-containing protein [Mycobacteriales bacterium]|jgi:transcriptional regulator GlxA family with amidase domain|nr:helix-turn-helix domain-containing protein [Mycobacteriales bacterium]